MIERRAEDSAAAARFRRAYAELRAREGRGSGGVAELLALPFLQTGPWAGAWRIRSRTYLRFLERVVEPAARVRGGPLRILDLGAGNGWLCYRLGRLGHHALAVDWRTDRVDGLGAAEGYAGHLDRLFARVAASFDALPFADGGYDIVVFNAALHYSTDLARTLGEAARVLAPAGRIAILDSPFYRRAHDGEAMVDEKRSGAGLHFGDARADLLALPSIEYLTRERLSDASAGLGLSWRRHRVRYPLRYELRPVGALLRGGRRPSRFDLWEGRPTPRGGTLASAESSP